MPNFMHMSHSHAQSQAQANVAVLDWESDTLKPIENKLLFQVKVY